MVEKRSDALRPERTPKEGVPPAAKSMSDRVWDVATRVMVPVSIVIAGALIGHEVRLAKIEANQFTDRDAAVMERRILLESPPPYLVEDIREIKDLLRNQSAQVAEINSRLAQLEAKVK